MNFYSQIRDIKKITGKQTLHDKLPAINKYFCKTNGFIKVKLGGHRRRLMFIMYGKFPPPGLGTSQIKKILKLYFNVVIEIDLREAGFSYLTPTSSCFSDYTVTNFQQTAITSTDYTVWNNTYIHIIN